MSDDIHGRSSASLAVAALTAAATSIATAAAVVYVRKHDVHVHRSMSGLTVVKTLSARQNPTGEPVRVMQMGGVYQSATYLDPQKINEPVFTYYKAFDNLFAAPAAFCRQAPNILLLGGGAFSYPKHLLHAHASATIEVVEIDPAVVDMARKYFYLGELEQKFAQGDNPRLKITINDGRTHLQQTQRGMYDAIINDTFTGKFAAPELVTVEAAMLAKHALSLDGGYLANVVSADGGSNIEFLRDQVATLSEVFEHVYVCLADDETFGGEDNYIVMASDAELDVDDIPFEKGFLGSVLYD